MSLLPESPRLRRILFAYTVNELGTWFGYVALALGVYDHTHSAIATSGLFVARGLLPAILAPLLVARVERSQRRGLLAGLYAIEALLTLALAYLLWRFSFPGVLLFAALDGAVAVAATAFVRASSARIAAAEAQPGGDGEHSTDTVSPDEAQRQANATLNVAFMVSLGVGPAIGGLLVHWFGGPVALIADAFTFAICALLMIGLRTFAEDAEEGSTLSRLRAALQHLRAVPTLRALFLIEAIALIIFASVEPVEVIYAKTTLNAGDLGYGLLVAAWGLGAALGAIVFARSVRRPLGPMLTSGTLLVGLAYLGYAAAPTLVFACMAAVVGGVGNGIQWPSLISAVQLLTPAALHGRLMSAVGSLNAFCPAIGFILGGIIVALTSPRVAMVVAGTVATFATIAFLRLPLGKSTSRNDPTAVVSEPELAATTR